MSSSAVHADPPSTYALADFVIASDLALPELRPAPAGRAAWTVRAAAAGSLPPPARRMHEWRLPDGRRLAWFGRTGDQFLLHFVRTASFLVDAAAGGVVLYPVGKAGPAAMRATLINQVMPLLAGLTRLVLHASAVADTRGAVAFAGPPGRGKSTLALYMAMQGYDLLTDDCLIVGEESGTPMAVPSGLDARLWPDSVAAVLPGAAGRWPGVSPRTTKRRIHPMAGTGVRLGLEPAPLRRLYLLAEPADRVAVDPVPAHEAVAVVTGLAFLLEVDCPGKVRQAFERVTTLVSHVPMRRLTLTRRLEDLPALRAAIEADLNAP